MFVAILSAIRFRALRCDLIPRVALPMLLLAPMASSALELTIADIHPGLSGSLDRSDAVYIAVGYEMETAEAPFMLHVRPYFRGRAVPVRTSPSPSHAGRGRALVWFGSLEEGQRIDRIDLVVSGAANGDAGASDLSFPVSFRGTGRAGAESELPPWVVRMNEAHQRLLAEPQGGNEMQPGKALLVQVLLLVLMAVSLVGWVGTGVAAWKWRGGWRLVAAVPAGMITVVVLNGVIDIGRDPTSHNLWPLELALYGVPSAILLVVMVLLRRSLGSPNGQPG